MPIVRTTHCAARLGALAALAISLGVVRAGTASIEVLEAMALRGHDPQVEISLVRGYMQAGDYRHALSFAAHVVGEHPDIAAAGVLYAWLLRVGGQRAVADRVLAEVLVRWPDDPLVRDAARALASTLPVATGVLRELPQRLAPDAADADPSAPIPDGARVVSSAVLVAGGTHALAPAEALRDARSSRLWVRNALGHASRVEIDPGVPIDRGIVVLRLNEAIDSRGADRPAERDPFAGSPGFAVEYAPARPASPAWPLLNEGFLGAQAGSAGERRLGIEVAGATDGGPVLDAAGRLAGIVVRGADGMPMLRPVSTWPSVALVTPGDAARGAPSPSPRLESPLPRGQRMQPDQAYERAMPIALQLIEAP